MSCKLIWTTTTTRWILQKVSVTADTQYDFSLWTFDNNPHGRIRGTLRWHKGDSLISSDNTPYSVDATAWQELTLSASAPLYADTVHVEIRVYDVNWGDTIFTASAYVDETYFGHPIGVEENKPSLIFIEIENPISGNFSISFTLKENSNISLSIYNLLGQKVAQLVDRRFDAGEHSLTWGVDDMAAGIYFVRLATEGEKKVRKIVVVR